MAKEKIKIKPPTYIEKKLNAKVVDSKFTNDRRLSVLKDDLKNSDQKPIDFDRFYNNEILGNKIKHNEDILQLFPDMELAISIMTASIISPNDMINTSLTLNTNKVDLPVDIKTSINKVVEDYIKEDLDLTNKLNDIIRESLFTKGAYVEAIIPIDTLDDILGINDGQVNVESNNRILSNNEHYLSTESIVKSTEQERKQRKKPYPKLHYSDLNLVFTDNLNELKLFSIKEDMVKSTIDSVYSLSTEDNNITDMINDYVYTKREEIFISDRKLSKARLKGKPLKLNLPVESVIPIHVPSDPTNHIGYYVLLDGNGNPVKLNNGDNGSEININEEFENSDFVNRIKKSLYGDTVKVNQIENLTDIYMKIVKEAISDKIKDGVIGNIGEIDDNYSLYKLILSRSLEKQQTKLLFIPASLVMFYVFDYRDDGTGKSMLEKISTISSIRAIILFTKLMATIKNSTTSTEINVTLDEDDQEPLERIEQLTSAILKSRQTSLPIGVSKLHDLTDWVQKAGLKVNFKHPSLPVIDIVSSDSQVSKVVPDTLLDESIEEFIAMSFGLTPEIIKSGYDTDFATTVAAKNLLFAKRVTVLQTKLNRMMTVHLRKLLLADGEVRKKIFIVIKEREKNIKRHLGIKKDVDYNTICLYALNLYIKNIAISLPGLELTEATALKNSFDLYKSSLDDYLDSIMSSENMPSSLVGELGDKIDTVKSAYKSMLLRQWMTNNNYLPEVNNFGSLDESGKNSSSVLDDYVNFINNVDIVVKNFFDNLAKYTETSEETNKYSDSDSNFNETDLEEDTVDNNDDLDLIDGLEEDENTVTKKKTKEEKLQGDDKK